MKRIGFVLVLVLLFSSVVSAAPLKVALLINGTLGDRSFFDSAYDGMLAAEKELGIEFLLIEMGYDQSVWDPTLADISEQNYDVIILGTWQMTESLQEIAPWNPDKKFIIFDTEVDYSLGNLDNVYSIVYKQNEGSFLAGALAAMVTTSDLPKVNADKTIGFLGGIDIPVINDFLVGYIEGALYIDPEIKVDISYIGSFDDSAKGKEMALAQYNRGVDIGFNVAGQAGLGQLDAAKDTDRWAIGVDSDQALLFAETDPVKADLIVTSMLKRIDNSLVRALKMHLEGTLPYGQAEALGLAEEAVGLANNEFYQKLIPEEFRSELEILADKVNRGEIEVSTALGMDNATLNALRDSVRP
ncbi:MAG: BMP family ABC transporter substrate-binding protein [Firmicutes bacterium]|nr:BMP family ABC transporter substrate-binding protein [Bacillota bacterium]